MQDETKHIWTAKGKTITHLNAQAQQDGTPLENENIEIFEKPYSFRMQETNEKDEAYGVPVSPQAAVNLMAELIVRLCEAKVPLSELPVALTEEMDAGQCKKMQVLLMALVRSFGMTFDRSILLKIMSQPSCEGIRFYPCIKKGDIEVDDQKVEVDFLSLVLVGVDSKGNDLHFDGRTAVQILDKPTGGTGQVAQKSDSLLSEYGHPPTNKNKFDEATKYSLLKIAKEEADKDPRCKVSS